MTRPRPTKPSFEHDLHRLYALCFVLSDRLSTLEQSNAELRAKLHLDPPPPAIGAEWMTVKHVMAVTNYSHPMVRKLIKQKKLVALKQGGRVLVSAASVAALGTKKLEAGTELAA